MCLLLFTFTRGRKPCAPKDPPRLQVTLGVGVGDLGLQRVRSAGYLPDLCRRLQVDYAAERSTLGGPRAPGV